MIKYVEKINKLKYNLSYYKTFLKVKLYQLLFPLKAFFSFFLYILFILNNSVCMLLRYTTQITKKKTV